MCRIISKTTFFDVDENNQPVAIASITIEGYEQDIEIQEQTVSLLHLEVNEQIQDDGHFLSVPISDYPKKGHYTFKSVLFWEMCQFNNPKIKLMDKLDRTLEVEIITTEELDSHKGGDDE